MMFFNEPTITRFQEHKLPANKSEDLVRHVLKVHQRVISY